MTVPEAKKRGRPQIYKDGVVKEPEYETSHPEILVDMMGEGKLDCEIFAEFGVCKDTFYEWLRTHSNFKAAHDIGLPRCEAWWTQRMRECWLRGDEKGFKYCIAIMNNKFGWGKADAQMTGLTQIHIGNVNVLNQRSETDLIEQIKTKLLNPSINRVIDVKSLETKDGLRKED